METANNRKRKLVTITFGGILFASTLLLLITADFYIDVHKTAGNVVVELRDITIALTGGEVSSILLTFMINNPSESVTIQVFHYQIEIRSLNENTTYLYSGLYDPQNPVEIIPEESQPIIVTFEKISETNRAILQWAITHEEWRWLIYINVKMKIGFYQLEVSEVYPFVGVDITRVTNDYTGSKSFQSQYGNLKKQGGEGI